MYSGIVFSYGIFFCSEYLQISARYIDVLNLSVTAGFRRARTFTCASVLTTPARTPRLSKQVHLSKVRFTTPTRFWSLQEYVVAYPRVPYRLLKHSSITTGTSELMCVRILSRIFCSHSRSTAYKLKHSTRVLTEVGCLRRTWHWVHDLSSRDET